MWPWTIFNNFYRRKVDKAIHIFKSVLVLKMSWFGDLGDRAGSMAGHTVVGLWAPRVWFVRLFVFVELSPSTRGHGQTLSYGIRCGCCLVLPHLREYGDPC